jgi:hypothetical protein
MPRYTHLTIGAVAAHYGVPPWQVRRLYERQLLNEPQRAGRYRLIARGDLPRVGAALRRAGYLSTPEAAHA